MKKALILVLIAFILISSTACSSSSSVKGDEQEAVAAGKITLVGLEATEMEVDLEEIMDLPAVSQEVTSVNSSGAENTFTVEGPLLEELLKSKGKSQKSFTALRLVAGDGYSVEVPSEIIQNRDIILGYRVDDAPLDEISMPVRAIIPEERAMYWVRNLERIEFISTKTAASINEILFLEEAINTYDSVDYTYYESVDSAIAGKDFFSAEELNNGIIIKAKDGLLKNETSEVFNGGYIKHTGADAPLFLSPDLPKGMHVKNILWFSAGVRAYYSVASGLSITDRVIVEDQEGIPLQRLFEEVNIDPSDSYIFTAADGYEVIIETADIAKGILFISEDGLISVKFDGLPKNTNVKGLFSIRAPQ